jgi:hypothetical protein
LVMEVLVAADFDMSLVSFGINQLDDAVDWPMWQASLIAVIVCDMGFSQSPPHSTSRMHATLNIPWYV